MSTSRRCPYCQCWFTPSVYRPQQSVCSQAQCQRQRRRDYHRRKLVTDEVYRKVAQDSQKKWRQAHPAYMRQYRTEHPEAVVRNRQRQQVRDQKPRLAFLEKPRPRDSWVNCGSALGLIEEAVKFAAGRIEGALLLFFRAVVDQWAAVGANRITNKFLGKNLS